MSDTSQLPSPTLELTTMWLRQVPRSELHEQGWQDVNQRFHGIAMAARVYANTHFANDPVRQEAFFDGLTLALYAIGHFDDVGQLQHLG